MNDTPMVLKGIEEASRYARVGEDVLREWMAREEDPLPHMRTGESKYSHVLFRRDLIDAWMEREIARQMGAPAPSFRRAG